MIFGHEGLPRSGKSLEAMAHVVDSLRAGRTVVTNIHGIDHKAISEYLAIPLPTVQRLLICLEPPSDLDEEQVTKWTKDAFFQNRHNDSLWIWDEINQFWPPERQPLSADWAKFVTEHGHKGIDILIMGQDLTELHQTWRKRLQRYTRFTKLDMLGKEDHYHWASYSNSGRLKFRKTADGKKPYNKDYFGFYKSHEDSTANKGNYKDGRFSIFQTKHKVMAAGFVLVLGVAVWNVVGFFNPELEASEQADASELVIPQPVQQVRQEPKNVTAAVAESVVVEIPPLDYLDEFASTYDLRLTGIIDRLAPEAGQAAFEFQIDFVDQAYRVKERMNRSDVASLGWSIERHPYGIKISKETKSYVVRPWPLDNPGRVPRETLAALKPAL